MNTPPVDQTNPNTPDASQPAAAQAEVVSDMAEHITLLGNAADQMATHSQARTVSHQFLFQQAVSASFWQDFTTELSPSAFFQKLREFICSSWKIHDSLTAVQVTRFCRGMSEEQALRTQVEIAFQAEFKHCALKIIHAMARCDESTFVLASLQAKELTPEQAKQKTALSREKTRARTNLPIFYQQAFDCYQTYLQRLAKINQSPSAPELKEIKTSSNLERIAAVKKYPRYTPRAQVLGALKVTLNSQLDELEDRVISQEGALQQEVFKVAGQSGDNQDRLCALIKAKLFEKPTTPPFIEHIINPSLSCPARYYFSQIPISYYKYHRALAELKLQAAKLVNAERRCVFDPSLASVVLEHKGEVDAALSVFIEAVLAHQQFLEIAHSNKKDTYPAGMDPERTRQWCRRAKDQIASLQQSLLHEQGALKDEMQRVGIVTQESISTRLKNYIDFEASTLVEQAFSSEEYRELSGRQILPPRARKESSTATLSASDIAAFTPRVIKKATRADLNEKGQALLAQLHQLLQSDVQLSVNEDFEPEHLQQPQKYYRARQIYNFYAMQRTLLEIKFDLIKLIKDQQQSSEKVIQNSDSRYIKYGLAARARKFSKYAVVYCYYKDLLEQNTEGAPLTQSMIEWGSRPNQFINRTRKRFERQHKKYQKTRKKNHVLEQNIKAKLDRMLKSELTEQALVSFIVTPPRKTPSRLFSDQASIASSCETELTEDESASVLTASAGSDVTDSQAQDADFALDDDEDAMLLGFLAGLYDNEGTIDTHLTEDLSFTFSDMESILGSDTEVSHHSGDEFSTLNLDDIADTRAPAPAPAPAPSFAPSVPRAAKRKRRKPSDAFEQRMKKAKKLVFDKPAEPPSTSRVNLSSYALVPFGSTTGLSDPKTLNFIPAPSDSD